MKMLEIFIGIVLVYFLYSLLTSIVTEILSAWMGLRARYLRQSIENILNGEQKTELWGSFLAGFKDWLLFESKDFKFTNAGKFYAQPEIRTLAKKGKNSWCSVKNTKPAYLSDTSFSKVIISLLTQKTKGNTLWEQVQFSVENNTLNLDPEVDLKFNNLLKAANGQFENFVQLLDNEYNEMMDRVSGWYKRKISFIIFWLGFVICLVANVDTIKIVKLLSKNEAIRKEIVALAEKTVQNEKAYYKITNSPADSIRSIEESKKAFKEIKAEIDQVDSYLGLGWKFKDVINTDSTKSENIEKVRSAFKIQKRLDSLQNKIDTTKNIEQIKTLRNALNVDVLIFASKLDSLKDDLNYRPNKILSQNDAIFTYKRNPNLRQKTCQIICQIFYDWSILLGILITALALTLGSQFWFDLLKKLVAIRSAGIKPEEEQASTKTPNGINRPNGNYPFSSNPADLVISEQSKEWENLNGFLGYNKIIIPPSTQPLIEILIDNGFQPPSNTKLKGIDIIFKNHQKGVLGCIVGGTDYAKGSIRQDTTNAIGTVAGIVYNPRTNKPALLTCGHVLRTAKNSFFEKDQTTASICNGNSWIKVGKVSNVVMSCFADGGVVDIDDPTSPVFNQFVKITRIREVNLSDELNPTFKIAIKSKTILSIEIYNSRRYFSFNDVVTGDVKYFDLLMLRGNEPNTALTQPGDSGALVLDDKGVAVGVIIGASYDGKNYSYAIKITDLFQILQLKPFQS